MNAPTPQSITQKFVLRAKSIAHHKDDWGRPVSDYGAAYYRLLLAEYQTLRGNTAPDAGVPADQPAPTCCQPSTCEQRMAAVRVLEELAARPLDQILWSDLLVFEAMLARLQTREALTIELILIRSEYKELVGAPAYERLKFPAIDVPFKTDDDYRKALAEYQTLLKELHWSYLSSPAKEFQRFKLILWLSVSLAVLLLVAWFGVRAWRGSVFAALVIFGGLGAWMSAFQRAYSGAILSAALLNLRRTRMAKLSFAAAPWMGALSAVVLALIFASGIISGKVFPLVRWTNQLDAIETNASPSTASVPNKAPEKPAPPAGAPAAAAGGQPPGGLADANNTNKPPAVAAKTNDETPKVPQGWHTAGAEKWHFGRDTEYALLLVWAVIAGFSERLVPDMLSGIAKKTEGAG